MQSRSACLRFRVLLATFAVAAMFLCARDAQALDWRRAITQYVHEIWQNEDGLPHNSIYAVVQTRDGYLWLGTGGGLVRFDGVRFTVFDKANTPAIKDDDVRALLQTRDGALWIGTYGRGLARLKDGVFTHIGAGEGLAHEMVRWLHEDREGALWVGTYGGGVSRLRNGKFTTYTTRDGLAHDNVRPIFEDRHGALWLGTYGGGISRFENGKFTTLTTRDGLPSNIVFAITEDAAGDLWIGTYGGGLSRYRDGRFTNFSTRDGLSDNRVLALHEDRDGSLWVGTYDGGLQRMRDGRFSTLRAEDGLSDDMVFAILEDREGALWIGTNQGGLNRLKDGNAASYGRKEGMPKDIVWSVFEDARGVWMGTEGGGLSRLTNGLFTTYTTANGLSSNNVISVLGDSRGTLWAGTFDGGLNRLEGGRFVAMRKSHGLLSDMVFALYEDRRRDLWIGTSGGLQRLRNGTFTSYTIADGLPDAGVRALLEDRDGALWIGTFNGLARLEDERFTIYDTKRGLPSNAILAIHEEPDGTLWIGTRGGGLARMRDGVFTNYNEAQGLPSDVVAQILSDGQGNLWMCGPRGVFRLAIRDLEEVGRGADRLLSPLLFGKSEGLKGNGCIGGSQPGAWRGADGRLWFTTSRGTVMVDPSSIRSNPLVPRVLIEGVVVNDRTTTAAERAQLPPGNGNIEINYTALSLLTPELVRFRYRLDPFDEEWVDAESRRVAYYTNVPPGRYTFRVSAHNGDGVWNTVGASTTFRRLPHFHQTRAFYAIVVCAAALLVAAAIRWRTGQLKRRAHVLAQLVDERTAELARANEMLDRLSRVDGLTEVANRREFDRTLELEWRRAVRSGSTLALLLVDIDCFKSYNDQFGHLRGDACLQRVAQTITSVATRAGELVARYGGEEFALIIPGSTSEGALKRAEILRERVQGLAMLGLHAAVTVSIGAAVIYPIESTPPSALIDAADRALYQAKRAGRNRVALADEVASAGGR